MKITGYKFGRIEIEGGVYTSDVIVFADKVYPGWWRKEGHKLLPEDLSLVIREKPEVLVVGCGAAGVMGVPDQTKRFLRQNGIEVVCTNTDKACAIFNEYMDLKKKAAAALHLTC